MSKSNQGVHRLLTAMKKIQREVNDQEICRRLEILMNSEKEDIPGSLVKRIFENPENVEPKDIPEPYTQYVMHYFYMMKRENRKKDSETDARGSASKKKSSKKKSSSSSKKSSPGKK